MCRRRFFKSYLYIEYGGIKYKNGETVSVSPFIAEGNSTTIVLDSARPWNITNNISWLTVSNSSNKSGTYTITLTAAANQSYDGRSGSFTAKTLDDRYSIVVSVSQQAQAVEYRNLTVSPVSMTLGDGDKLNGKPIQAFVDEYINGSYARTKEVTTEATWTSQNNSVAVCAAVSNGEVVKPVYGSGYYPEERETTVTASYLGSAATCNVEVEPQGLGEYRLDVSPTSVVINSDGTQALTVWARYYVDGVYTPSGDELITDSSEYEIIETSVPDLISVDDNGVIHGNGVAAGGTATIRVSNYPTTGSKYADVEVTVNPTSITYRNLVVNPTSMELDTSDLTNGKTIQAYADEYINGTFNRTIEVTSAASWSSQDTSVAACESVSNNEVVKPVYGSGDYPTTRTTTVTTNYMGSAATCTVSVAPEGRVTYLLVVSPTEARIGSNGSTSLTATLQAYVDGVRDSSQDRTVTTSANYNESSNLIEVDSAGHVTGTGQLTGGDAIITVNHHDAPNSVSVTIHVNDAAVDEYLEITPASTSTTWNGQVTYEVFYVREVNGQKTSTKITDASVLHFDLSDGTIGEMNGFVFNAENISTAYTDEEISVTCTAGTYSGFSTRTPAELRVNGADSVAPRLDITAPKYNMASAETMQISATYVIVVNGNDYKTEALNPTAVTWSENSNYASISNASSTAGRLTSNNSTDSTQHVTATGVYNSTEFGGVTGHSTDISIAKKKPDVTTWKDVYFVSGSTPDEIESISLAATGSKNRIFVYQDKYINDVFDGWYEETNTLTYKIYDGDGQELSDFVLSQGYSDDYISISYSSSYGISITSTNSENEAKNYTLEAYEGQYIDTLDIHIAAAPVTRNISVTVNNKVTSNAGGTCGSLEVSWTGLTVGTWIDISATNASVTPEIQVTATTGSWTLPNTPTVGANGGSSRSISVTAQWREDTSINDTEQWTQSGGYVSPQIKVAVKDKINSSAGGNCERLTVSWTALTVGTYIDLDSLNADLPATQILVQNATDSVQWDEYPVIGQNRGGARTIAVSATWRSDNDVYDAESWTQQGNYSPTYHVWIKNDTSSANFVNDSDNPITIETFAVSIDNRYDFALTGDTSTTPIAANSNRNLNGNLTGATGTNSYQLTVSWRGDHHDDNSTVISWKETKNGVTTTRTYSESDSFETTTDIYYIDADTELSDFVVTMDSDTPAPVTYQIIFGMVTTDGTRVAGNLTYNINGGGDIAATMTPTKTVTGIPNGATVTYVMSCLSSGSWLKYSGSTVINGANQVIDGIAVPDSFKFNVRSYATPDSENNVFRVDYLTKNGANGSEVVTCVSGAMETITINLGSNYVTTSDDYFRYTVTKIGGRINISGWDMTGTNGSTTNASTTALNNQYLYSINIPLGRAGDIYVSYRGTYPSPTEYTGTIYFNAGGASNWSSCNIYVDDQRVLDGALVNDSGTFTYTSLGESFMCSLGGGLGDGKKYKRFSMEILDNDDNQLWSGACRYLYTSSIDFTGVTLTARQLDGSHWFLYDMPQYGDIRIYAENYSGNIVPGDITNFRLMATWSNLKIGTEYVIALPNGMTHNSSATITIPINSTNGSNGYYVNVSSNTGTSATGTDVYYTVNGTATDVNNDVIHARCTIIHEYKQAGGGGSIIRLVSSDSIPVPASDYGANVIWGNLPNDELTINIEANNCTRVYIVWDPDIGVGSFNLAGASDGSGHYYIENDNYIVPSSSQITFSLTTDVSRQIHDPENDYSGYLHLTGYDANDNSVSIEIYFAP